MDLLWWYVNIDQQREEYDALLAHDKALEKAFKRDFYEKDTEEFYDYLFKVFKRRPKAPTNAAPGKYSIKKKRTIVTIY